MLSSTISACAATLLPGSVVTNIMKPVIEGVAQPLVTQNNLLGLKLNLLGQPVASISIDTTGLLNTAATTAGTVALNRLTAANTPYVAGNGCFSQANGFTIANPTGGIAVGGNQITGLGNGLLATAGELASIAFGNGASTDLTAVGAIALGNAAKVTANASGSVALGNGATASLANSIALGANTTALRGALTGYAAAGLSALQTSAGEVSIGAAGALRQLTNLAAGSADTDAVNVAQLNGVVGQLAGVTAQYDATDHARLTLNGLNGTVLANVKAGALSAGSTEAVNGSQLYGVVQDVGAAAASVTQLRSDVVTGLVGPVRFSAAGALNLPNGGGATNDVALVGASLGAVGLHNVAAGSIGIGSTDAVNGGQLALTNAAVDGATQAIQTASTTLSQQLAVTAGTVTTLRNDVAGGALGPLRFLAGGTPSQDVTLVGGATGTVKLHNVGEATLSLGSTEAVNGGQLWSVIQNVTADGQAISTINGQISTLTSNLGLAANDLTDLAAQVALQGTALANNSSADAQLRIDLSHAAIGPVRYSNSGALDVPNTGTVTNDVTLVGLGQGTPVGVHNVAAGSIALGSTDAVNGGQLYAVRQATADLGITVASLNGALGGQAQTISTLQTTVGDHEQRITSVQATLGRQGTDLSGLQAQVSGHATLLSQQGIDIAGMSVALTTLRNGTESGSIGPVRYSDALTPTVPNGGTLSQDLTLVGLHSGPIGLHNLAAGVLTPTSSDAVTGGQLFGASASLAGLLGLGFDAQASSFSGGFSFGGNTYATLQGALGAIYMAVGSQPTSSSGTAQKYFHTTSIMADSSATGVDSTAVGPSATASGEASVAAGRLAIASGDGAVAIGNEAQAVNGKAVSIGFANLASGDGAVAIGDPNYATGDGAIAMGKDNSANGDGAIGLGNTNVADGIGAVAVGRMNQATGDGTTAIGSMNVASGDRALAIGVSNAAGGDQALAIGSNNVSSGVGSVSIGRNIANTEADTLAIGRDTIVSAVDAIGIGNRAQARARRSTAIGNDAAASGVESAALGQGAAASGLQSSALGTGSAAGGSYALAVGTNSVASQLGGVALGFASNADALAGTALGSNAIVTHEGSVALGSATRTVRGALGSYAAFGLAAAQSSGGEVAISRNIALTEADGTVTMTGDRQITGLAAGAAPTDAVNVAQLRGVSDTLGRALAGSLGGGAGYDPATGQVVAPSYLVNGASYASVGAAISALSGQIASGTGGNVGGGNAGSGSGAGSAAGTTAGAQPLQYSSSGQQTTPVTAASNDVTLVGRDAQSAVTLHNVAEGRVEAGSTDAVNGAQLAAVATTATTAQATATAAQATATRAATMASSSVQYDPGDAASVTLGGGNTPVALHNVADARSGRDAINLNQLGAGMNAAVAASNAYTDQRIAAIAFDLRKINRNANAGTASAMAAAAMPQAFETGRGMFAMSVAAFQGEQAIAIGMSKMVNDRAVVKVGATYNSRGKVAATAGFGWRL